MAKVERNKDSVVRRLYSEQKDLYAEFASNSFSWSYIEKPLFEKKLPNLATPDSKIFDAGCGTGRTLNYLLDKGYQKNNLIGVDVNKDMLSVSSENAPGVALIQSDLEDLPFRKNSVDLIICTHVLHLFDEEKFSLTMSSFHKTLKQNGVLFWLIVHPVRSSKDDFGKYFIQRWIEDTTPWETKSPLHYKPVSKLVNLTIDAGFAIDSIKEPEVLDDGKEVDPGGYKVYSSYPFRLAVIAKKLY